MTSKTNEKALETCIETALINSGYKQGKSTDFNPEFAIDTAKFWQFLETTQPEELDKLKDHHNWQRLILERLNRKILKDGVISVLKKGISLDNAHLTLHKKDRDPQEALFNFARCFVHLAVDTYEVYMTSHLEGKNTYFLPFNKGNNHGQGNPINPNGHKTAYLWTDILTPESLTNIIEHFAILVTKKNKKTKKITKNLYFPRYHQLEVVRKLIKDTKDNGIGKTYLIQHSAGSGKSNSITWTAYQLIEMYQKGSDKPLFDSVIVVAVNAERRRELDLYKRYASDPEFKRAFDQIIIAFLLNNQDVS